MMAAMRTNRTCSHAGFFIALAVLGALLGLSLFLNFSLGAGLAAAHSHGRARAAVEIPEDEAPDFAEVWSYGAGDVKAVRLSLEGIITRQAEETLWGIGPDPVEELLRRIRAATRDEDVRALVLEVDSPGGEITPTDEIHRALRAFRESRDDRRVMVYVRDLAASGGYYAAVAGDRILAQPTAIVGSIGVIMQTLNWRGLSEKIGLHDTTIKSGANKDLLNPFRETPPEQLALLQSVVDRLHTHFKDVVRAGRNLDTARLDALADGRIFLASEAVELGLIDGVGGWEDVLEQTRDLLEEDEVRFVRYETQDGWRSLLRRFKSRGPRLPWSGRGWRGGTTFQYLWQP